METKPHRSLTLVIAAAALLGIAVAVVIAPSAAAVSGIVSFECKQAEGEGVLGYKCEYTILTCENGLCI